MKRLKLDIQKFGGNYSVSASVISQDIANNRSTVRITATSSTTYDTWNEDWDGYIQGSYSGAASGNLSRQYVYLPYWSSYSVSWDITVPHKADGTCDTLNISCYHYITDNTNGWSSTSVKPATIPRHTTVSTWSVKSKTETSITMSWKTADNVSAIKYGINTSSPTTESNLNKNSGEVTISGLTAGETYTLYFMPQRKDSGLWGDGSSNTWKSLANQSTHPYPSCTSAPNFKIGEPVTLTFNNPRNRTFAIRMWSHVSQGFVSDSINISGTSYTFTPNRDYIPDTLYNSIPNNAESIYNIDCTTDGHKLVKQGGTYSVRDDDNPDFSDFNYVDSGGPTNVENVTTVDLTGDNQTIIPNYSLLIATIPAVNRAIPKHGASMSKYKLSVGSEEREEAYSESTVNIRLDNAPSNVIKVFAIDSRNLSTPITKTASVVDYTNVQKGNINISRQGNVGEAVTLTFNGTFWNGDFGNQTNALSVKYRYKKATESWPTPENWNGQTSIVPTTTQGSNDYSFSGGILGDTSSGFDTQYSYNVEVQVSDKLSSTTFSFVLGTGIPTIAVADEGVAIKQPYDTNDDSIFQVNGKTNIKGILNATGNINSNGFLLEKNSQVTPIDITDTTTTLLSRTKALGTNGVFEAIWFSRTDGGTSGISDKPTGTANAGFVCHAVCDRWASNSDYRYVLECFVQTDRIAYYGIVENGTSSITWLRQFAQKLEATRGRPTTANITHSYENSKAHLELILATASMATAKPNSDGYILHCSWDNDGKYDSQLYLPNNSDNHHVQFRGCNNGTWGSWEDIYRAKTLYTNASGTTGSITLSESVANFAFIEIFTLSTSDSSTGYSQNSTRVWQPNGKSAILFSGYLASNDFNIKLSSALLSGTNITRPYGSWEFNDGFRSSTNFVGITKVVGYR